MQPINYENEFILYLIHFRSQLQLCANSDKSGVNLWGHYFYVAHYASLHLIFCSRVIFAKVLEGFVQFSQGSLNPLKPDYSLLRH